MADLFPASSHILYHGLDRADDAVVWEFARRNGYTVVTKDADFIDLSTLHGCPPQVLWIRIGNCTTSQIETLLRHHYEAIANLETDATTAILILK